MEYFMKLQHCIIFFTILLFFIGCIFYVPSVSSVTSAVQTYESPITHVQTTQNVLSLTFDLTNNNEQLSDILSLLDTYQVKATFFVTGTWASSYPEDIVRIHSAGHEIGNYTNSYVNMTQFSKEEITNEISSLHNTIKQLTGSNMTVFRSPYGEYNSFLISQLKNLNYSTIQWNIDSLDWKGYRADYIVNHILQDEHFSNGSIILFHNDGKYTKTALELLIPMLQKKGFSFVPTSKLLQLDS